MAYPRTIDLDNTIKLNNCIAALKAKDFNFYKYGADNLITVSLAEPDYATNGKVIIWLKGPKKEEVRHFATDLDASAKEFTAEDIKEIVALLE